MTPTDPHLFGRQIFHVSRAWRAELDRRLSHLGLSQARWQVLLNLARMKGVQPTQRELAQSISIEGPTLARLLDGLEKQGLVKRLAVTEDRRAKRIMLTQEAGPLIEKIETIAEALRKELLSGLDDEEIAICQQVHQRVLANLERG
ncbi:MULTISPECIES: MarR family transcriptional regulator [Pseudomonadaceae]|jgi:MarR family transcriptional regulator for hemolysin|uniref:MarR family transcriptional regulator n=3 Tax=Pseudomonadaceae TaxID=135621 RepID=A0A2Z5A9A3_9PSED|nr:MULTISPECIES: MarR family transcriptional regulator [Pseudomonas]AXA66679.1 MarR family transcriptional regulator [Pseudomonas oryzihabitans]EHK69327.1 MarR family transcriptional regulator [Pseudomonas psychrotolerans L19]KIZ49816.1 MarR family transcriptional regulator [Pseudomonas oryzihabitans]KTT54664.1 MarR family transcriptional regulator [Pseudomonas psychrotolerans]MBA1181239.1 MarR family transcriptional regulator [Pseudomonas psychrotolerans]